MTDTQKYQLALYYMFAYADKHCTEEEKERLRKIERSYGASKDDRKEIEEFVQKNIANKKSPENAVIRALGDMNGPSLPFFSVASQSTDSLAIAFRELVGPFSIYDSEERLQTLWMLIVLGYADEDYSEAEKKIIDHISKKWEIDDSIISIMTDTAETMCALEGKKRAINSYYASKDHSNSFDAAAISEAAKNETHSIDLTIKRLIKSVDLLIADADLLVADN